MGLARRWLAESGLQPAEGQAMFPQVVEGGAVGCALPPVVVRGTTSGPPPPCWVSPKLPLAPNPCVVGGPPWQPTVGSKTGFGGCMVVGARRGVLWGMSRQRLQLSWL